MTTNEIKLAGEARNEFGKGAARRLRRDNKVPAVVYGHGQEPQHIALPGHETLLALRTANALLSVDVDGQEILALPKQVQRDPIKGFLEHVDLLIVKRGEKVTVEVPVLLVGEQDNDRMINQDATALSVEAPATNIPAEIEVSFDGLAIGDQVLASQVKLPEGVTLVSDPETLVINVTAPISEEALEAELDAAVADATDDEKVAEQEAAAAEKSDDAEAPAEGDAE